MSNLTQVAIRQYGLRANVLLDTYRDTALDNRAHRFIVHFNKQLDKFVGSMSDTVFKSKGKITLNHSFTPREIALWNLPERVVRMYVSVVDHLPYDAIERVYARDLKHEIIVIPPTPTFITKSKWGFKYNKRVVVVFQLMIEDKYLSWHLRHLTTLGSVRIIANKALSNNISSALLNQLKQQACEMLEIHEYIRAERNDITAKGKVS